jgi:hypothetical protein
MASEVKTNKLSPSTGVTVTLGDASDVFQLPASAEIDIASGATLDVNGTIDLTGATKTGFPAGGLTDASQWRLTTDFTGDVAPIATNLEEADTYGAGTLGSSMTQSSGIFTFPSTGYWLVRFHADFQAGVAHGSLYNEVELRTTLDNGATLYNSAAMTSVGLTAANHWSGAETELIFDVTDTTLCKCRFDINVEQVDVITKGNTGKNETFFTFIKLADT